ncbi:MAG: phosphoenolpyruvate synthase [Bacteroidales bacterium]|nr:phosphoenolpyruvate synthase [Bacteroidales bacterium]
MSFSGEHDKGQSISAFYMKDASFANLMQKRIFNVLLIASRYDAFILEEDGRIEEHIFLEYMSLNLSSPPRVTEVYTFEKAEKELRENNYDLIIVMPAMQDADIFKKIGKIKAKHSDIPLVLLTPFSHEVSRRLAKEDLSAVDYTFSWLGNADLLLAIVKLMEDNMNLEEDVASVGVQVIIVVEDSIRFYSSILPILYKVVLKQSQIFSTEALNRHEQMLRMRGRPKIVLARNYEEAVKIYDKYSNNVLGVVTDVSFKREGEKDSKAGLKFCSYLRQHNEDLPIIIDSSDIENKEAAAKYNAAFLYKNSKTLPVDLKYAVLRNFGYGDFEFIRPVTGEVVATVKDLKELQDKIFDIPDESILYHASRNHISSWLYSRAMFPLAELLRQKTVRSCDNGEEIKHIIFEAIVEYRKMKNSGVVAIFERTRFDRYSNFARIGQGSLGGKGRGLAFVDAIIKRHPELANCDGVKVSVPKTIVLSTDIFDEFMEGNNLYSIALSDIPDEEILSNFLKAELPERLDEDFLALFDVIQRPIAIRSSSLLEDSHYQPFAGIYSTYMVPYIEDKELMLKLLKDAIKGVYASVYYSDSKAYMEATSNIIDQEKMAIILQEVVGNMYDKRFYPSFSGVGRSLNYYPINDEKPEDGVVDVAVGLGKYIVDGGRSLRFSPKHPNSVLQTSTMEMALSDTQTRFYALDMENVEKNFSVDDGFNIQKLSIADADADGSLYGMVSTYDYVDQVIRDGYYDEGRKVVTFANILKHDMFPLAKIMDMMLTYGKSEMGRPVEIEFAGNLKGGENGKGELYWLQIRPIVDMKEMREDEIDNVQNEDILVKSTSALGHGIHEGVTHVVYVKDGVFGYFANSFIAREIEKVNKKFLAENKSYILIGPGRWGSSDTALGIPIKWPHISAAKVIVETAIKDYWIEPSQGTHFFQNLTSFGVGYFTIDTVAGDGIYDKQYLDSIPSIHESEYIRVVELPSPMVVKINGKKNVGIVIKPMQQ